MTDAPVQTTPEPEIPPAAEPTAAPGTDPLAEHPAFGGKPQTLEHVHHGRDYSMDPAQAEPKADDPA